MQVYVSLLHEQYARARFCLDCNSFSSMLATGLTTISLLVAVISLKQMASC